MSESTRGLKRAGQEVSEFGKQFKEINERLKGVSEVAKTIFEPALQGVGFAAFSAGGAITALLMSVNRFGEAGASISDFSRKTQFAVDRLQQLEGAAGEFHLSADQIRGVMAQLAEGMAGMEKIRDAGPMFNSMVQHGLRETAEQMRDIMKGPGAEEEKRWKSFETLLGGISKQYGALGESAARGLLGQAGLPQDLASLLREGPEGVAKAMAEVKRLQGAYDPKAAEEYEKAINKLKNAVAGLQNSIGKELLNEFSALNSDLAEFIAANREGVGKGVHEALTALKGDLHELAPLVTLLHEIADILNAINNFHPGKVLREKLGLDKLFPGDPGEQAKAGRDAIAEAAKRGAVTQTTPQAPLPDQYKSGGAFPDQMLDLNQNLNPNPITSKDITAALALIPDAMRGAIKDKEDDLKDSGGSIADKVGAGIKSKGADIMEYGHWLWDALKHAISMSAEAETFESGGLLQQAAYHPGGGLGGAGGRFGGRGGAGGFGGGPGGVGTGGAGSDFGPGGGITRGTGPGAAARSGRSAISSGPGGNIPTAGTGGLKAPGSLEEAEKAESVKGAQGASFMGPGAEGSPGRGDPRGMLATVREEAIKNGIDPNVAEKVARSEGLGNFKGDGGTSFGAMQLHTPGGLGDDFRKETGLDPSDPKNEKATIAWAMKHAAKIGNWGPWHGAKNTGIPARAGFGNDPEKLRAAEANRGGLPRFTTADVQNAVKGRDAAMAAGAGPQPGEVHPGAEIGPNAEKDPSGNNPNAFVMHHTSGGAGETPEGIVNYWRNGSGGRGRGIGAQYIMDRQGVVHDVRKEFGYDGTSHVLYSATPKALRDQGLTNPHMVGMEVMAKNDKDVLPVQIESMKKFMRENYPNTPIETHGHLNPGHREPDEGRTMANAVLADRAQRQKEIVSAQQAGAPSSDFAKWRESIIKNDPDYKKNMERPDSPEDIKNKSEAASAAQRDHLTTLMQRNASILHPNAGRKGGSGELEPDSVGVGRNKMFGVGIKSGSISAPQPGELSSKASKASAMEHKVNVQGTGKLDVNVNAPKGTNVKASGGGMFKETKLNRSFAGARASETA